MANLDDTEREAECVPVPGDILGHNFTKSQRHPMNTGEERRLLGNGLSSRPCSFPSGLMWRSHVSKAAAQIHVV